MAMNMGRAFHPLMLVKMKVISTTSGHYNDDNDYVGGVKSSRVIRGVIRNGNRYSQFEESISRSATAAGERFPDYRTLFLRESIFGDLSLDSHIIYKCVTYNILQKSDETHFGFSSYILERDLTIENKEDKYE